MAFLLESAGESGMYRVPLPIDRGRKVLDAGADRLPKQCYDGFRSACDGPLVWVKSCPCLCLSICDANSLTPLPAQARVAGTTTMLRSTALSIGSSVERRHFRSSWFSKPWTRLSYPLPLADGSNGKSVMSDRPCGAIVLNRKRWRTADHCRCPPLEVRHREPLAAGAPFQHPLAR